MTDPAPARPLSLSEAVVLYQQVESKAQTDLTAASDFEAAYLCPSVFLSNPKVQPIELTFDKIIYHLDHAYQKASTPEEKTKISRAGEEIFHKIVTAIDYRQRQEKKKLSSWLSELSLPSASELLQTIGTFFAATQTSPANLASAEQIAKLALQQLKNFIVYLAQTWEQQNDAIAFREQIINVYLKIQNSKFYNPEHGLLDNTFRSLKATLLPHALTHKGLTTALLLTENDRNAYELNQSAQILHRELVRLQDWENLLSFLELAKQRNLVSFPELKTKTRQAYAEALSPARAPKGFWGFLSAAMAWLIAYVVAFYGAIGCFLFFFIATLVWGSQSPAMQNRGGTLFLLAILIGIASIVVAGIALIVFFVIRTICRAIHQNYKTRQFEKRLNAI